MNRDDILVCRLGLESDGFWIETFDERLGAQDVRSYTWSHEDRVAAHEHMKSFDVMTGYVAVHPNTNRPEKYGLAPGFDLLFYLGTTDPENPNPPVIQKAKVLGGAEMFRKKD